MKENDVCDTEPETALGRDPLSAGIAMGQGVTVLNGKKVELN